MALSWTQPQCEACWVEANAEWIGEGVLTSLRVPVMLRPDPDEARVEQCAWCGCATFVGIYVRVDPTTVPYPRAKEA